MTDNKIKTFELVEALKRNGYHCRDVEFDDGYFIFKHGKDSVVRFHIKECPYWLFGIWWSESGESFDFFAQYEREIDKFKPAASFFVEENIYWRETIGSTLHWCDMLDIIRYIHRHPFKAWSIHIHGGTRVWQAEEGLGLFWCYVRYSYRYYHRIPQISAQLNRQFYRLLEHIGEELLLDYRILDFSMGREGVDPQYELLSKKGYNKKALAACKKLREEDKWGIPFEALSDKTAKEWEKYKRDFNRYEREYGTYILNATSPESVRIIIREEE